MKKVAKYESCYQKWSQFMCAPFYQSAQIFVDYMAQEVTKPTSILYFYHPSTGLFRHLTSLDMPGLQLSNFIFKRIHLMHDDSTFTGWLQRRGAATRLYNL